MKQDYEDLDGTVVTDGMLPILTDQGYFLVGPQGQLLFVDQVHMTAERYMPRSCLADQSDFSLRDSALAVLGNIAPFEFVREKYPKIDYEAPNARQFAAKSLRLHAIPPRGPLRVWLSGLYGGIWRRRSGEDV